MSETTGPEDIFVDLAVHAKIRVKIRSEIAPEDLMLYVHYRRADLDQTEALLDLLARCLAAMMGAGDGTIEGDAKAQLRAAGRTK